MSPAHGVARRAVEAPVEIRSQPGLCTTCVHDVDCGFRRDPALPVVHCEEFEAEPRIEVAVSRRPVLVEVSAASAQEPPEDVSPSRARGLCRTCDHRLTCRFPVNEAGIWHCEEYE